MHHFVGVDVGTGSVKAIVLGEAGESLSASSAGYPISSPRNGWAEQDPEDWWLQSRAVVDDVLHQAHVAPGDTVTVGFTGQMHSMVLLDGNQHPVRPAILWADHRAQEQVAAIHEILPEIEAITGNPPMPAFTLPQLLWVRDNEPETFADAKHVLVTKDWVRLRATGQLGTDWTDASGMAMLDSRTRQWSEPILSAFDIERSLLPDVAAPTQIVAELPQWAPPHGTARAVVGVGDQFAEALASGVVDPGDATISLGTSATVLTVRDNPASGTFCHAPRDRWLQLDSLHSGGMSLTWLEMLLAPQGGVPELLAAAAAVAPGSDGLLFLPFLAGERGAGITALPGAFVGLQREHHRGHLVRAVLEGVALELRRLSFAHHIDAGRPIAVTGGGARSELWVRILAAVFDRQTRVSHRSAAFGAALVAGVGAGHWASYTELPPAGHATDPDAGAVTTYEDVFGRYLEAVSALKRMSV
jgi:xylulokinase